MSLIVTSCRTGVAVPRVGDFSCLSGVVMSRSRWLGGCLADEEPSSSAEAWSALTPNGCGSSIPVLPAFVCLR